MTSIMRTVKKNHKTTVTTQTISIWQGWRYQYGLDLEAVPQDANHLSIVSKITICKQVQRWATNILEQSLMDWWDQDWPLQWKLWKGQNVEKEGTCSWSKT